MFVSERQTRDETFTTDPVLRWHATIHVPDVRGFDVTLGVLDRRARMAALRIRRLQGVRVPGLTW